jgi:hypothetical protein
VREVEDILAQETSVKGVLEVHDTANEYGLSYNISEKIMKREIRIEGTEEEVAIKEELKRSVEVDKDVVNVRTFLVSQFMIAHPVGTYDESAAPYLHVCETCGITTSYFTQPRDNYKTLLMCLATPCVTSYILSLQATIVP